MQRTHIVALSLHPGLEIQCALDEAAVVAAVQQSCSPVEQHSWASRRLCLAKGVGYGPGEHLPPLPFTELSMDHRLRKPEPPNTSSEINMTSQLSYVCQKVALKTLRIQRFGNLRAKAGGMGGNARNALRNLCILNSKCTITAATKGFINTVIAMSVSSSK